MSHLPYNTQLQGSSSLKRQIRQRPMTAFLAIVYIATVVSFLPPLLSDIGLGLLPFTLPAVQPFVLLLAITIAAAAFVVTAFAGGRGAARALRGDAFRWRVGLQWYLLAVFGLPLAAILGATVVWGSAPLTALARSWPLLFTAFLPQAVLIAILVSIWEEIGWTGFAFPRLQRRYGPLPASLMVNTLQALVHVPLLFIVGGLNDSRIPVGEYPLYLFYLFVATIPVRILMSWLYNATGRSLIVVALFHGAMNVTAGTLLMPKLVPTSDTAWVYGVFAVCAVLILIATRGRLADPGDGAGQV